MIHTQCVNTIKWVKHILLHSRTPVLCCNLDTCVGFLVGQTYFTADATGQLGYCCDYILSRGS